MRALWRRLRELLSPDQLDRESIDEMNHHIEMAAARHLAAGLDAVAARRQARLEVGSVAAAREAVAEERTGFALDQRRRELLYAVRVLQPIARVDAALHPDDGRGHRGQRVAVRAGERDRAPTAPLPGIRSAGPDFRPQPRGGHHAPWRLERQHRRMAAADLGLRGHHRLLLDGTDRQLWRRGGSVDHGASHGRFLLGLARRAAAGPRFHAGGIGAGRVQQLIGPGRRRPGRDPLAWFLAAPFWRRRQRHWTDGDARAAAVQGGGSDAAGFRNSRPPGRVVDPLAYLDRVATRSALPRRDCAPARQHLARAG